MIAAATNDAMNDAMKTNTMAKFTNEAIAAADIGGGGW